MREEGIQRLIGCEVDDNSPYFLVYRSLNPALATAAAYGCGVLLDIGCGNKPYESLFSEVTKYIGCDMVQSSEHCVDIIADAAQIPVSSKSVDTVFSTQVIEHVPEPARVISEAFRLLKPGGYFILSGPMYWHLHEEPHDYFRFTKHGFKYLIEKSGFEVVEIIPNGGKWAILGQVLIHTIQYSRLDRPFTVRALNRIFAALDDRFFNDFNTTNYVVVARKVAEC